LLSLFLFKYGNWGITYEPSDIMHLNEAATKSTVLEKVVFAGKTSKNSNYPSSMARPTPVLVPRNISDRRNSKSVKLLFAPFVGLFVFHFL